jgi:flagellin-like hook-associated protein FlgL
MVLRVGSSGIQSLLIQNHSRANQFVNQALERLSTGFRINHASDDPAGMIAAVKLRTDLLDISAKSRVNSALRSQNRIKEGGLRATSNVLQELRGLAVQASGNTNSKEVQNAIQLQVDSSLDALELIASTTGTSLPSGLVNLRSGGSANLANGDVAEAVKVIDQELSDNNASRLEAGVYEKYTLDVDQQLAEALAEATASSLSSIEDADYAQEISNLVVGGILAEASIRTLALSHRIAMEQADSIFDSLF